MKHQQTMDVPHVRNSPGHVLYNNRLPTSKSKILYSTTDGNLPQYCKQKYWKPFESKDLTSQMSCFFLTCAVLA